MTQISILSGIYADPVADLRTAYPRNYIPVPKQSGVSSGYLRPADGIELFATGPGVDRGAINWNGVMYRVMGTRLVRIDSAGVVTDLGDVGAGGTATMDYSFDRLAIASGGRLYYFNGSSLLQVTDPDLGNVLDMLWVAGYFMTTDGANLIVTELNDPFAVNPLKYGSSEADPDPVLGIDELRNEVYAFNRYTVEVFENVGGDNFPFQRIEGAQIPRGTVGTHAYTPFAETFAMLGSGRNEALAVYLLANGATTKLSTREVDEILAGYSEAQLSTAVLESRIDKGHIHLLVRLPDRTLVYDLAASQELQQPVWFSLDSGLASLSRYRAINLVYVYGKWLAGDPDSAGIGELVKDKSTHYGEKIGWEFVTTLLYNEGRGAIFHDLELVSMPGRVPLGLDPVIWTSYSVDGETWSQERAAAAGKQGERQKRICWRRQGNMKNYRIQRFRGTSDAFLSILRLEANLEPLAA